MSVPAVSTNYLTLPTGEKIFYRTSGEKNSSTILLLHGFPSSSHHYRNLIPLLAHKYRVIAPDLPGYGFTTVPEGYKFIFQNLTDTIKTFIGALPNPPKRYAIYLLSFGAAVGFGLALSDPSSITGIVSQNANAYEEGLTAFWDPIRTYWHSGTKKDRDNLRFLFTIETTKTQYFSGSPHPDAIAPESYTLDQLCLDRPGSQENQLDLFYDYPTYLALLPKIHEYFRMKQVPLLAVWGRNDPVFATAGAEAYKKDLPNAEVHLLDTSHFAAETNTKEIADLMLDFFERHQL
ncbi:alpha/beta-hydrolase [Calocera viscosa TUFC12733]|uniref:Alpha/beta-hydrolase n=1 Tax=Calocera viscosa (strain TUFC12733) TaxID=1330018 RepID=A0A167QY70_CALVF|nr:alpha/beta-hydrolase [Calocera viscosa TUFC12733]